MITFFEEVPQQITEFEIGHRITRENITSFLIFSFTISRGKRSIQQMFYMWQEKLVGFDYFHIFENFVKMGTFECLQPAEQEMLLEAFKKVPAHRHFYESFNFEDEIRKELADLHKNFISRSTMELALNYFDFKNIKSLDDFKKSAKSFLEKYPS